MKDKKNRVFLIGVRLKSISKEYYEESMQELFHLADTAGTKCVGTFVQTLETPNITNYIGKGKLEEIRDLAKEKEVDTIIFNNNLSPSQSRNISDFTCCNVVDRTELILDIFAKHARTKQAKLQVELAQLEYAYTKLKRMWKHLSRIKGGIGFRGPGETQIEVDRREIRRKTEYLQKKLEEIEKTSFTKRKKRSGVISVALVGYTNAGKSTLFNTLTHENRYTADQLFATLDSKTRLFPTENKEKLVITDTIGFIRELPHKLVTSFQTTLLEVLEADLLLHVVDVAHPNLEDLIDSVNGVLKEIGVGDKNVLIVFNKIDKMSGTGFKFLKKKLTGIYPDSIFLSAKDRDGISGLYAKIDEFIRKSKTTIRIKIPVRMQKLISFVYSNSEILVEEYDEKENAYDLEILIKKRFIPAIKEQMEKEELMAYLEI